MSNEEDAKGPDLKVVKPSRHKFKLSVTREIYEAAEVYWLRQGIRRIPELAKHLKISLKVARTLVYNGYPSMGWASLRDRARLHDAQRDKAREQAQSAQAREEADELLRAKRDNVLVVRNLRALGMVVAQRINAIIQATPQVQANERLTDAQTAAKSKALAPAANSLRAIATALRDLSASELVWIKETRQGESEEQAVTDALLAIDAAGWAEFSRTGKLPANLPAEALDELVRMGFKTPPPQG